MVFATWQHLQMRPEGSRQHRCFLCQVGAAPFTRAPRTRRGVENLSYSLAKAEAFNFFPGPPCDRSGQAPAEVGSCREIRRRKDLVAHMLMVFHSLLHDNSCDCRLQDGLASMRADFSVQELRLFRPARAHNACSRRRLRGSCAALSSTESAMSAQLLVMLGVSRCTSASSRKAGEQHGQRHEAWRLASELPIALFEAFDHGQADGRCPHAGGTLQPLQPSISQLCASLADWQAAVAAVTAVQAQEASKLAREIWPCLLKDLTC